jgi:hypothetical protein
VLNFDEQLHVNRDGSASSLIDTAAYRHLDSTSPTLGM